MWISCGALCAAATGWVMAARPYLKSVERDMPAGGGAQRQPVCGQNIPGILTIDFCGEDLGGDDQVIINK